MRILTALTAVLVLSLFAGCGDDQRPQYEIDREEILKYLRDNNIEAFEHPSGLFYDITREGNGERPRSYSAKVRVKYKGYLTDGTVFDETTGSEVLESELSRLIPGWQIGIPLLSKGGAGTLFLPSALGYGASGIGDIPPNSVLIFDVELLVFVE